MAQAGLVTYEPEALHRLPVALPVPGANGEV